MSWVTFRAVYDLEGTSAVTANRLFLMPAIGPNQAYSPYYVQCAAVMQNVGTGEITGTNIERAQLVIGRNMGYKSLDDNALLCDARDPWVDVASGFRFKRNGVWDQVLCRTDPFRERNITVRCRVDRVNATDLTRVIFKLYYEVINITYFQARVLDSTGVWMG